MRTILLPMDLGVNTAPLLDYAVSVAAQNGASLLLLHVIRKQPYDNGTFEPDTAVHRQLRHEAQVILEQFARQTIIQGIRSRTLVVSGVPAEAIVRCARETRAGVILMERGCADAACTTEQVMRLTPCPILTWQTGLAEATPTSAVLSEIDSPALVPVAVAA